MYHGRRLAASFGMISMACPARINYRIASMDDGGNQVLAFFFFG